MARKKPSTTGQLERASTRADGSDEYRFTNEDLQTRKIDLVELTMWPPRQGERSRVFPVWPDLRIAEEIIVTDGWRIVVHLTRAELAANFVGCRVAVGTRRGDTPLPSTVETTETETGERDSLRSGGGSGGIQASLLKGISAKASLLLKGNTTVRSKTATKRQSKVLHQRVATLPNDRWEISELRGRLRGPYLVAPAEDAIKEKPLCEVIADANEVLITLSLEARPTDLDPDIAPHNESTWSNWSGREKPNKVKITKLLVTRACTDRFGRSGDERVVLARAILRGSRREMVE